MKNKARFVGYIFRPCKRVLDIGCGANWLKRNTGISVIGIDENRRFADVAADCRSIPFKDGSFDGLFAHHVLEHLPDPERCFAEMARVLQRSAAVYIEVPAEWNTESFCHRSHRFQFTGHIMKRMLKKHGFAIVRLSYGAFEIEKIRRYPVYRLLALLGQVLAVFSKKRRKVLRVVARKL